MVVIGMFRMDKQINRDKDNHGKIKKSLLATKLLLVLTEVRKVIINTFTVAICDDFKKALKIGTYHWSRNLANFQPVSSKSSQSEKHNYHQFKML